jgi:uncharacterized repeat protein (TIGR01451 family)
MKTLGLICALWAALGGGPTAGQAQGAPDLTVTLAKAGAQPEVPTRTNVAFVATISNIASVQATNVLTRVTMPAGFTGLSTTPAPGSGITCSISGVTVNCTAPTMPGNSQKTFRISSTAPATITGQSQDFTLTAGVDPANAIAEGPGGNTNNSDNFTVRIATRADLSVDLTSPGILTTQVAPNLTYVVAVRNTGDRAASTLLVRATLPKDVEFQRVQDNTLGTCLQNSTASNGAQNINCTLSSLAAGATGRVRILARVLGSVPDRSQVTFAAAADPQNTIPERNDTDNTAFMVTTLRAPADVQITAVSSVALSTSAPPLQAEEPGDVNCVNRNFGLTIGVRNNGPYQSPAAAVTIAWPPGFSQVRGSCFGRCNVPALNSGQAHQLNLTVHVDQAAGVVRPAFVLDADQAVFDPIVGNNRVTRYVCGL